MQIADDVTLVVVLLGVALGVGVVAERLVIPNSVALILAGITVGLFWHGGATISFGAVLLLVLLPALIFEATWSLDVGSLRRNARAIALLAVPGVVVTACAIGFACAGTGAIGVTSGLLLGSIVAATDPVAVVAVFRRVGVPVDLATLVEGESIANDGTTLLLFQVLLTAQATSGAGVIASVAVRAALLAPIGGAILGAALAGAVGLALRSSTNRSLLILGTAFTAYGSYLAADRLHLSGIFATASAAIVLRVFDRFPGDDDATREVDRVWAAIAVVAEAFVFLLAGIELQPARMLHEPIVVAAALAALVASRALLAYGLLPLLRVSLRRTWHHVVALAGIRGALSLALALSLPSDLPDRPVIVDVVFAVVAVTLVGQGLVIRPILERLRL